MFVFPCGVICAVRLPEASYVKGGWTTSQIGATAPTVKVRSRWSLVLPRKSIVASMAFGL